MTIKLVYGLLQHIYPFVGEASKVMVALPWNYRYQLKMCSEPITWAGFAV